MSSADTLTAFEQCNRRGFWAREWEKHRLAPIEMVRRSVIAALIETVPADYGERAGEELMTLASERGQDLTGHNLYRCAINHASIADLVTTAIRKPNEQAWRIIKPTTAWSSSSLIDRSGTVLHRFLPVSTWNPERAHHEIRSWYGIGEVSMMKMPMRMIVAILGPMNGGRRHGYWSKALHHPTNRVLRFKLSRKSKTRIEGFKDSWIPIYKEEHDEIPRAQWLETMHEDDVLRESLFAVDVPVPGELEAQRIRDMARRKLDLIATLTELPEKQLSTCRNPLSLCPFLESCWGEPESPPHESAGFDRVS